MEVELHPEARAEMMATVAWYLDADAVKAADAFLAEIDDALDKIEAHPLRWPAFIFKTRRFVLSRFPHSVIYSVLTDRILVVAVAPDRKRQGYWRKRLRALT